MLYCFFLYGIHNHRNCIKFSPGIEARTFHGNAPFIITTYCRCIGVTIILYSCNAVKQIIAVHTMDLLWEKFKWILPLYMKPISFQSKTSVVCSVTAAIFVDFCLKKLKVFSQHIGQETNEYLNSAEEIPRNWNVDQLSVLISSWDII